MGTELNQFTAENSIVLDKKLRYEWLDKVTKSMGGGGFRSQYETFFHGLDRFQHNLVPPNAEHAGVTFITRPRLCLKDESIRQQTEFAALDTTDNNSIGYAIRCLLDTKYSKDNSITASNCRLLNINNPFFTPICNGLQGISGYPDPTIQTITTDAGFHSEDQTYVIGWDQLNKSYDLSLTFKDIQNGPLASIFFYWMIYMGYVTKGMMPAYPDDIAAQRMNYTVSIYRFRLDPTRKFVTGYSKATGCFPKSLPMGAMFNYAEGELYNSDVGKFTVPFAVNKIEYNKYETLMDFNMLVNRYNPFITAADYTYDSSYSLDASNNYKGMPWIDTSTGRIRLLFVDPEKMRAGNKVNSRKTGNVFYNEFNARREIDNNKPSFLDGLQTQQAQERNKYNYIDAVDKGVLNRIDTAQRSTSNIGLA